LIGGAPKLRELGFPVHVQGLAPEAGFIELRDGPVIEARRVPHNDESIAYSVRYGGRRIVYTGDTGPDPELGVWASEADLLLAECSLPDSMAIPTHLSPERCAALAATANPRQLVLTHFFPPAEQEPVADIVSQQYSGPVILATDGWSTTLEEK
jgi:ribonuclease BN (tRNA processing enzyme)